MYLNQLCPHAIPTLQDVRRCSLDQNVDLTYFLRDSTRLQHLQCSMLSFPHHQVGQEDPVGSMAGDVS